MRVRTGILALALTLIALQAGNAQLELSCTAFQYVAIQSRLQTLTPQARQVFQGAAAQLHDEMVQLHTEAKALEKPYLQAFYEQRNEVLDGNPELRQQLINAVSAKQNDLVNQYLRAVIKELAQQAQSGQQEAHHQLEALVLTRLSTDPRFIAEFDRQANQNATFSTMLQERLLKSPKVDEMRAAMITQQQELNRKERELADFKDGIPSMDSERKASEAARAIAEQTRIPIETVTTSRPFRDLLVTAYYAQLQGTRGGQLDEDHTFVLQKFDTDARQPGLNAGIEDFVHVAELSRTAMREVKAAKLEVELGLGPAHFPPYLPPASLRPSAMKDKASKLAQTGAKTAGELLNLESNCTLSAAQLRKVKVPVQASNSLDTINVPSPSPAQGHDAPPGWARELATTMKENSQIIIEIIRVGGRNKPRQD
jgi:hypothetical protein